MNVRKSKSILNLLPVLLFVLLIIIPIDVCAKVENEYELGDVLKVEEDEGFSEQIEIDKDDPHFNWDLGKFTIKGYTRAIVGGDKPIFLKTLGDNVVLNFVLEQNIDALNNNESLLIADDEKAYDSKLYRDETRFGRGALIIRKTDAYTNKKGKSQLYVDYLPALEVGANTQVEVCEEGDYEVSLDYSIQNKKINIPYFDKNIYSTNNDYKISFAFSIRNGNCMVFPFDVTTGEELTNKSITENGFYLDLAKSRYLEINVKKEMLFDGDSGLTEDVRFNKPATDGEKYIDEGIYTIKVSNPYTNEETIKKICVGSNSILKAYMKTGYAISDIRSLIKDGATIDVEGNIMMPVTTKAETETEPSSEEETETSTTIIVSTTQTTSLVENTSEANKKEKVEEKSNDSNKTMILLSIIVALIIFSIYLMIKNNKKEEHANIQVPIDPQEIDLVNNEEVEENIEESIKREDHHGN